ncbi:TetR/AcrR family transcriptional regulator [Patulibacter brassicae]|uniref:TetR/AcrR family transcriptional regulator n=1 Tax=Patulibacter brassicae TaxID=1705717 RepID=A0ABU4VKW4_9ACTN|nr:TetR/AcrR family transcriptional regulator [Patulibacter brassicae]MDX8152324.1 TetR/AcrR family transcriptional regulator [Patulibacter brassicae]
MASEPDQPRRRGRRPTDPQVVVDALARLLEDRPLQAISVEELLQAAGVARSTFYTHFPTKFAVARSALDDALREIDEHVAAFVRRDAREDPVEALRRTARESLEVWLRHRAILEAVLTNAPLDEELAVAAAEMRRRLAQPMIDELRRRREERLGRTAIDPQLLGTALMESTLRLVVRAGRDPELPDEQTLPEVITTIWGAALLLEPQPGAQRG